MTSLPPLAPFPKSPWRQNLSPAEWTSLLEAWTSLSRALVALPDASLKSALKNDDSVATFLTTFVQEIGEAGTLILGPYSTTLSKAIFQLTSRVLATSSPPLQLLSFPFLADLARVFPRKLTAPLIAQKFCQHTASLESSLLALKKQLILQLDGGIKGDLKFVELQLTRLNHLLHISSDACTLFLAGSDFLDGLIVCFRVMNPPLRKVIVTTTYLCLVGLIDAEPARWAMLNDELYALKASADAHKEGPLNVNDSLVPELVTNTPILKILLRRAEDSGAATDNLRKRITVLEAFKKGAMIRPKRLIKRKVNKGKGKETSNDVHVDMHVHKMSQISQVQDLFPDLGAGFVSRCLDEYGEDVEQVVANLLSETLPSHLATADRSEPLYVQLYLQIPPLSLLTWFLDRHVQNTATTSWHRGQRHPKFLLDTTSTTMTSSTSSLWTCQKYGLERSLENLPTTCLKIKAMLPTKQPSSLLWHPLIPTMMNAMIHMTRQM